MEVTAQRNKEAWTVNQDNKKKIIESGGKVRSLNPQQREAWVKAPSPRCGASSRKTSAPT